MQGLVQQCNIHHIRSSPYITAHLVTLYPLVTQTLPASACLYTPDRVRMSGEMTTLTPTIRTVSPQSLKI